ncbi:MAG: 30S ribosomal protein S20 [Parachlamydiaceae bacterium]
MAKDSADKKTKKVKRPTPLKRDIQNNKKRLQNRDLKSRVRTALRSFEEALPKGDAAVVKEKLNLAYSVLDKAVKKGIYKLNKASRTKARLTARVK